MTPMLVCAVSMPVAAQPRCMRVLSACPRPNYAERPGLPSSHAMRCFGPVHNKKASTYLVRAANEATSLRLPALLNGRVLLQGGASAPQYAPITTWPDCLWVSKLPLPS